MAFLGMTRHLIGKYSLSPSRCPKLIETPEIAPGKRGEAEFTAIDREELLWPSSHVEDIYHGRHGLCGIVTEWAPGVELSLPGC